MNLKLIYGLKDDKLVHISEVESGLKCNCICPSCKTSLIARKGSKVKHHFAHNSKEDCGKGYETAIHILAKEILSEETVLEGPEVIIGPNDMILPSMPIRYNRIEVEKKIDDIIADIVVYKEDRPLILEIFVTHKIDDEKENKLQKLGISTMEIDLSSIDREIDKEELREILLKDKDKKRWIINRPLEVFIKREEQLILSLLRKRKTYDGESFWQTSYIKDCPKETRKNWRIPVGDFDYGKGCSVCLFFQGYEYREEIICKVEKKDYPYEDEYGFYDEDYSYYDEDNDPEGKGYYYLYDSVPDYVYCGFNNKITDYESVKRFKAKK